MDTKETRIWTKPSKHVFTQININTKKRISKTKFDKPKLAIIKWNSLITELVNTKQIITKRALKQFNAQTNPWAWQNNLVK